MGFRLSFVDLDYSMSPFGELGSMHRLGLSARFGAPRAARPLSGEVSRVKEARLIAPREKIDELELFARDFLTLAEKDLGARRYVSALGNMRNAFNLDPGLRDGAWGAKERRLELIGTGLGLGKDPGREEMLSSGGRQADTAHEALTAYVEGYDLKALLLAHAALGENPRDNALFSELLSLIGKATGMDIRRDEVLPRETLLAEKLRKSAEAFYAKKFDETARECAEIVLLDERNHAAWVRLGSAYHMLGDERRSREAFFRALEIKPDDPVTREFIRLQGWEKGGSE